MSAPHAPLPEVLLVYLDDTGARVTETYVFESVAYARRLDLRALGIEAEVVVTARMSPALRAPERIFSNGASSLDVRTCDCGVASHTDDLLRCSSCRAFAHPACGVERGGEFFCSRDCLAVDDGPEPVSFTSGDVRHV